MPKACCVPKCSNYFKKGKSETYHIFPKDESLKNEWIRLLKIERKVSKHAVVCSDHFKKSDYTISNRGEIFYFSIIVVSYTLLF